MELSPSGNIFRKRPFYLAETLRIMRLTAFLVFAACLHVSAGGYAQGKLTLFEKEASLGKVFKDIQKQTGFYFVYYEDMLVNAKKVSLDVQGASLEEVLSLCFKDQPLTYTIVANSIVVQKKEPEQKQNSQPLSPVSEIHGTITSEGGAPIQGVTVMVKGTDLGTVTDEKGNFILKNVPPSSILVFSHIGFERQEVRIGEHKTFGIQLKLTSLAMGNVTVEYSTGYQKINPERATGSFVQIDNDLYSRRVTTDVLSEIDGIASGVYFNGTGGTLGTNYNLPNVATDPNNKLGITIRGQSTLSADVSKDPLIVVDNFPYEGDINNLNPEMVESITVLKDASAASIWGARAGNGVIVITTKKGKYSTRMKVDLNENITIGGKPNVFYSKSFLNSSDFINVEDTLFNDGYFSSFLASQAFPAVSPVVALLSEEKNGQISASDAQNQINSYRTYDVRNDYEKYIYQNSLNQQYALTMRGGTNNLTYALSTGYDNVKSNLERNGFNRMVINSYNTYTPIKNLELTGRISYMEMNRQSDNSFGWGTGGLSTGGGYNANLLPYTQLANSSGQHLPITYNLSNYYVDSLTSLGFLNWQYNPLNELAMANNTTKQTDIILQAGLQYKIFSFLNIELQYQNENQLSTNTINYSPQSYMVRNLVNKFTQYAASPLSFNYPFPQGGILNIGSNTLNSNNVRSQLNFSKLAGKHNITGLAGAEIRETTTSTYNYISYGYESNYGTAITNLDYSTSFAENPVGSSLLPSPGGGLSTTTNRYVSYFTNWADTYAGKYTLSLSGRKDGANIFGVNTNDKISPFWSTGMSWALSKEAFYQVSWLPTLNLRGSYGFNGNVYNGIAYLTAAYSTNGLTGLQQAQVTNPPNPDLSWEKVKNVNIGMDFGLIRHVITGTIEWYLKEGEDLIEQEPLAPSTGFSAFNGNAASTRTKGADIIINSTNINRKLTWNTTLLFSTLHNKVLKFDVPQTETSIQNASVALTGRPIAGVYSYKWAGLDPTDGDPQGYLAGKVSKDYVDIINNYNPDSLSFNGSSAPTVFGSLRNSFYYQGFSASFNIIYKFGYVFRRPSTSIDYSDIISNPVYDYVNRWQKTGDEKLSNVPSVVYPNNPYRNTFYQYSSVLVENGSLIRLQDIRLGYDLSKCHFVRGKFEHLELFTYANNIGLIWKKNKYGIDPDFLSSLPNPRTISFGIKANL